MPPTGKSLVKRTLTGLLLVKGRERTQIWSHQTMVMVKDRRWHIKLYCPSWRSVLVLAAVELIFRTVASFGLRFAFVLNTKLII